MLPPAAIKAVAIARLVRPAKLLLAPIDSLAHRYRFDGGRDYTTHR